MANFGFGAFLIDRGAVTADQLAEALHAQVVCGGRLGTNLVELGILDLDDLARLLGEFWDVPVTPKEWLEAPQRDALAILPVDLCDARGVLPLRVDATRLHVALLEPSDERLVDEIEQISGRRVSVTVLPELRLRYALERHLGIERPVRFMNVAKKLEHVRREAATHGDDRPEEVRLREALGIQPLSQGEDLSDESEFTALHQRSPSACESPAVESASPAGAVTRIVPAGEEATKEADDVLEEQASPRESGEETDAPPVTAVALEAALAAAADRDEAVRLAVALAGLHAEAAALLVVHRGMVIGLRGCGGVMDQRIEAMVIPIDASESVFARVATSGDAFRGAPASAGLDARLLRGMGRRAPREIAVLPVSLRGRVVNLLYADGGEHPLAETALGALSALVPCLARSYERLILAHKRGAVAKG